MSRSLKKTIYGIFYLAVIVLVAFLFYNYFLKPAPTCFDKIQNQGETGIDCGGPCGPCATQQLSPLQVLSVNFFGTTDGRTAILANALNPNANYGATAAYQFSIYNKSNQVVETLNGTANFRSGEGVYIFSADAVTNFKDIEKISLTFQNPNWQPGSVTTPNLILGSDLKTALVGSNIQVTGTVLNQSPWSVGVLKVIAVLSDKYKQIFASQTVVNDLQGGGEASFTVLFPNDPALNSVFDPKATQIFFSGE